VDVEVLGFVREQFVERDAFEYGGARSFARRVRLHQPQGILDLLGVLPVPVFVAVVVGGFAVGGVGMFRIFAGSQVEMG